MRKPLFTPEELAELARIDAELAEKQRRYYEANKAELAEKQRRYREANKEDYNSYMREYMRAYNKRKREATTNAEQPHL